MEKSCGFCDCMREKLIMDRLILGIRDQKTRERLISQQNLDLKRAIFLCNSMEATQEQMKVLGVTDGAQDIHAVRLGPTRRNTHQPLRQNLQDRLLPRNVNSAVVCTSCRRLHAQPGAKPVTCVTRRTISRDLKPVGNALISLNVVCMWYVMKNMTLTALLLILLSAYIQWLRISTLWTLMEQSSVKWW